MEFVTHSSHCVLYLFTLLRKEGNQLMLHKHNVLVSIFAIPKLTPQQRTKSQVCQQLCHHRIKHINYVCFQMFWRCQRLVQQISCRSRAGSRQEQRLTTNVVSSIARTVQELSLNFRQNQSTYLRSKSEHCTLNFRGIIIMLVLKE